MRKGSFTVEAAVVMWLVLTILYAFVYLAFVLHDRLLLYGTALYETAGLVHRIEEPVSAEGRLEILRLENQSVLKIGAYDADIDTAEAEERFLRSVKSRLYVTEAEEADIRVDRSAAVLRYAARIRMPFGSLLKRLMPDSDLTEQCVRMSRRADPEEIVRLTGGLFRRK